MPLTCIKCRTALIGKQTRFCSDVCRNGHWSIARKKGESLITEMNDADFQGFMNDIFRVLEKHKATVDRIVERNRQ